jgi:molybdate transport system substrate-binding protein
MEYSGPEEPMSLLRSLALGLGLAASLSAGDLVVSAAASLTEAFQELGRRHEARHPGTKVVFNTGASDKLLAQILAGAPVDVFASADQVAMDKAVAQRAVDPATRATFAGNALVLIVPAGASHPATPAALLDPKVGRVAVANPASVPAGRYTREALEALGLWAGVEAKAVFGQSVRQCLDYVARGEVDAGFVYATDAAVQAAKVKVAALVPTRTPVTYPIAVVAGTRQAEAAKAFVALVCSAEGREVLARFGFTKP